jgi:hypothetical protein
MRIVPNRAELSKFFDMHYVDTMTDTVANEALKKMALGLLPTIIGHTPKVDDKKIDDLVQNPELLNQQFAELMTYCMNNMINYINTNGERAIKFVTEIKGGNI